MKNSLSKLFLLLLLLSLAACNSSHSPQPGKDQTPIISHSETIPLTELEETPLSVKTTAGVITPDIIPNDTTSTPTATQQQPTPSQTPLPMPVLSRNLKLESPAMRGDDVKQLQTWLLTLGYSGVGTADGVLGILTDTAIRQFQQSNNLTVDGIVGPLTWTAIYQSVNQISASGVSSNLPTANPNFTSLSRGASGVEVKNLKLKLVELGYPICDQNSYYDLQTEAAVRQFQVANGITADGITGSWTWDVLFGPSVKPYQQPEVIKYQVTKQYAISNGARGVIFDNANLWFINNNQVIKFDIKTMQSLSATSIPYLGQQSGFDGIKYDVKFQPKYIIPPRTGSQLWLFGLYGFGYATGTDAVLSISTSGNLLVNPYQFPGDNDYAKVQAVLHVNNDIWAFQNYAGEMTLYTVDTTGGLIPTSYMGYEFSDTEAYAWDGNRLWGLIGMEGYALAPIDPYGATYGTGLGPCGKDLAADGTWLWVLRDNTLYAYGINGQLLAMAVPPDGYTIKEIVVNSEFIVASAFGQGKNYIIVFER